MKTMQNVRRVMLAAVMIIACTASFAQHGHHVCAPHMVYTRPAVETVVTRPAVSTRMSNWLSRQDSLDIALAYLAKNKTLHDKTERLPITVRQTALKFCPKTCIPMLSRERQ